MRLHRATLEMASATGTGWAADTIFGHLCWLLRFRLGEDALTDFLGMYQSAEPPLVLSNGFPAGHLPRPLIPTPPATTSDLAERRARARAGKAAGDRTYVPIADFNRILAGESVEASPRVGIPSRLTLKNQISRTTGTTGGEGQLYEFAEMFWSSVDVFALVADDVAGLVGELFGMLAESGYGKRKSVGYGQIASVVWSPAPRLGVESGANGFVSISNFVPARGDPVRGSWRTIARYGKLGEAYALDAVPFKRPLLMLAAGSAFYAPSPRPYYGRLVEGVSPSHPQVVQHGLAVAVPARLAIA
jgi:CRISPR-associated protein Csm4